MITFIDFFAGIGGFRSGFTQEGFSCVGYCESDAYARKTYEAMYDTTNEWKSTDIRKVKGRMLPKADIWAFGFPCQDISIAGKREGMKKGNRSGLFYEMMRLLSECKNKKNQPRWIVIENVRNLLSINRGWGLYDVFAEMDRRGYDAFWRVCNSKDYGVPQNRKRIFIIGHLRTQGRPQILFERTLSTKVIKQIIPGKQGERVLNPSGTSNTLCSTGGGTGAKTGLYFVDITDNTRCTNLSRTILTKQNKGITSRNEYSGVLQIDTIHELHQKGDIHNDEDHSRKLIPYIACPIIGVNKENYRGNGRRIKNHGENMYTLTCQDRHGVFIKDENSQISIRRLTPRECFRLQGFTDEQFDKARAINSDTQLYKQAGNAVTVNVAASIARTIKVALKKEKENMKSKRWMTIKEVSEEWYEGNISENNVRKMIENKELPCDKVCGKKLIPIEALEERYRKMFEDK